MKFVFFGYDFSLPTLKRLIKDGHELLGIFTFPCDNVFNYNQDIIALANDKGVPITLEPANEDDIASFLNQGCEAFICCGYPNKIPPINENKAYAINTHPTFLPMGRGIMPTPDVILKHPEAGGFTIHKMTQEFDAGDILYQEKIEVTDQTNVDNYSASVANNTAPALSNIMQNPKKFWEDAAPQDESKASWFSKPTDATRTLHWHQDIKDLDRILRAFGTYGTLTNINDKTYAIFGHKMIEEAHDFDPGMIVEVTEKHKKITTKGGYILMTNYRML